MRNFIYCKFIFTRELVVDCMLRVCIHCKYMNFRPKMMCREGSFATIMVLPIINVVCTYAATWSYFKRLFITSFQPRDSRLVQILVNLKAKTSSILTMISIYTLLDNRLLILAYF